MSGFTTELQPAPCIHVYMHIHTRKKINAEACTLVSFFSACEASPKVCVLGTKSACIAACECFDHRDRGGSNRVS